MGVFIVPADLTPFASIAEPKALAMIEDAEAMAVLVAPCITGAEFAHAAAVKALLRAAILRWHASGSGAAATVAAGPFSQTLDTSQPRRAMFWPSEIEQLQDMCSPAKGGAYAVDTVVAAAINHSEVCALVFGAEYCSCGAILTGLDPLYE